MPQDMPKYWYDPLMMDKVMIHRINKVAVGGNAAVGRQNEWQ